MYTTIHVPVKSGYRPGTRTTRRREIVNLLPVIFVSNGVIGIPFMGVGREVLFVSPSQLSSDDPCVSIL